jgi:ABC-2 type transport system permease protein
MLNLFRPLIRASSFIRKEIAEIIRQPRLVFTLVLGPFLILLIFGIGYKNQARALRTIFVADPNSQIGQQIQQYATSLGPQLVFEGVTADTQDALNRLGRGEVDVVAVAPNNAYETIRSSQQAVFILYHREIDPFQRDYINYFGNVYVDEVNRRILRTITAQGQTDASTLQKDIKAARANAAAMRAAIQAGDQAKASQERQQLNQNMDTISLAVGASLGLLGGVQQTLGQGQGGDANQILQAIQDTRQNSNNLDDPNSSGDSSAQLQKVDKIESDLATMDQQLSEFRSIDPDVIVSPFRAEAKSITSIQPTPSEFFAPAVLALLLQHLAVTFAALSIVRERTAGTMELFRVSPISALETLIGKYVSYMIFGGVIAAALSALMVFALHVPMLGGWGNFIVVLAALLFTSLGYGFLISIFSQTDSQAVQYSMILLLASVFFSGFIMSLEALIRPVRVVSWALPVTYGTILLRNIMLRGIAPEPILLAGLAAIGLGLFALAWLLLHRLISVAST